MNSTKIIIVEDEKEIGELISAQLKKLSYDVEYFVDGSKAHEWLVNNKNDSSISLIILDRMLPSMSGLQICKSLREMEEFNKVPILILTALGTPDQIIEGLDSGADDYMTKPFDINILLARLRALIRRHRDALIEKEPKSNIISHKDIKVDMDQCQTWVKDEKIELTLSEYKILCCFLLSPGKVLTRNQLVEFIQDGPVHVTDRTIDTHIFGLRKKLGESSSLIETIRGIGYRVINND